jgi:hypothetical protein
MVSSRSIPVRTLQIWASEIEVMGREGVHRGSWMDYVLPVKKGRAGEGFLKRYLERRSSTDRFPQCSFLL